MAARLAVTGLRAEHDYKREDADRKVRNVLTSVSIPAGIDRTFSPW